MKIKIEIEIPPEEVAQIQTALLKAANEEMRQSFFDFWGNINKTVMNPFEKK